MKKSIIYILLALFVWTMAVPAAAQKKQQRSMKELDPEAAVEAVKRVIRKHQEGGGLNLIEKEIYPQFKKNPDVLTQIAHAFDFQANDTKNAFIYIDRALAVNPNYVPAFVEKGNILFNWAKTPEDSVEAYSWYDKAISVNPKDSLGYYAYARILAKKHDYDGAAKKLEEILQHDPNQNVYVEIGRIYGVVGLEKMDNDAIRKSIDSYAKADLSRMTANQIQLYISMLHTVGSSGGGIGAYNRADSILNIVLPKYPRNAELNRRMLINDISLKRYDHALVAADNLFNNSDSLKVTVDDYMLHAEAYIGLRRYNDAITAYRKALDVEIDSADFKSKALYEYTLRQEGKKKTEAVFAIASAYDKSGYTDKAIEELKAFIAKREEEGKLDAPELQKLANYYLSAAEIEMNPEVKISMYKEAYDLYGKMAEVSPDNASIAYYTRNQIGAAYFDPHQDNGFAVGDAETILKLISVEDTKGETRENRMNKAILKYALEYLVFYYFNITKTPNSSRANIAKCGYYLRILRQVEPESNLYKTLSSDKMNRRKYGL